MAVAIVVAGAALAVYVALAVISARTVSTGRAGPLLPTMGRRVGLPDDGTTLSGLAPRLAAHRLTGALGGAVGGAAVPAWQATNGMAGPTGAVTLVVGTVVAVLLGRAVALAGLLLVEGSRLRPGAGPRVARIGGPVCR